MRLHIPAACLTALILSTVSAHSQTCSQSPASTRVQTVMSLHATGPFDVKIDPQSPDEKGGGAAIGRMLIDKHFHGDLDATSKGTMLAAGTGAKNSSGGYVALEIVTGTLKGRTGTFILQHSATMNRGVPNLSVTVVPDSGTGQLTGLTGKMNIIIADGKHSYDFEYTLPKAP
jgi:Protein of unknown function (DUF3224)